MDGLITGQSEKLDKETVLFYSLFIISACILVTFDTIDHL